MMQGTSESSSLEKALLRAQAAEHDNLILLDRLALKDQRDIIASGRNYDAELGVDTEEETLFDRQAWRSQGHAVEHYEDYEASPTSTIEAALDALPFPVENATFIDFGCGKARTLLMAARLPFRRAVGIEIMPELVVIGRENIAKVDASALQCSDIEVVETEASTYEFPPGDLVIYMYNPFDDTILRPIVERLVALSDRRIAVAYYSPKYRKLFEDHPDFTLAGTFPNGLVFRSDRP